MRLDSNITDYDTERIIFPNIDNVSYRIESAIAYLSHGTDSGHYVIRTRSGNGWKWISDDRARNYSQLAKYLKNKYLLFLSRNV
jgi:hypothetical protein